MIRRIVTTLLALAGLAVSAAAWADPPARVGRLSTIDGTVSMHMSDQDQWSPAAINYPVTTGTSFWTEPEARAALDIGPTSIHLDGGTELDIVALDDSQLLANAPQGRINIWVPSVQPNDFYSIATPRGALEITAPGTYRITAGNDQEPTEVAVLDGAARLVGPTSTVALRPGEAATATGPSDGPSYSVGPTQPTPFDDAALASEHRGRKLAARQYISPEMTGYEDLDDHGAWRTEADVGPVWYPQAVPAEWEPYRYGRWAWIDPWGWTWIDDQPWGFAPFHYGRWSRIHDRWGWVPGRLTPRPAYAPALVAFIGGGGLSVGLSLGSDRPVGWFPLAPREVYVPPYSNSVSYARRVNITNVVNVNNITNQTIRDGHPANASFRNRDRAVVVRQSDFAGSRPVARAALAVQPAALAAAPVTHQSPATRASAPGNATPNAAAPGPRIRHADRTPGNAATPNAERGGATPSAQAPGAGAPAPQNRRGGPATANVAPGQRGAPAEQSQGQANPPPAAAPGPPIRRDRPATATVAPAQREAPAVQPQGQANPPPAAAPGPPIRRDRPATATVAPAQREAPAVQPQGQANPPPAAAPGPPIRRDRPATATVAPAQREAPAVQPQGQANPPPAAAPAPPTRHAPENAAPARREAPAAAPPANTPAAAPAPARREERPAASAAPAARPAAAPAAPPPREAQHAPPPERPAARAAEARPPAPPPAPHPAPAPRPAPAAAPAHPAPPAAKEEEKRKEEPHP